jgi:hypothetical protein
MYRDLWDCSPCPAGYHSSWVGVSCAACPSGYFTSANTSSACKQCAGGKYARGLAGTSCAQCKAGRHRDWFDHGKRCTACTKGTFSATGARVCWTCGLLLLPSHAEKIQCHKQAQGNITGSAREISGRSLSIRQHHADYQHHYLHADDHKPLACSAGKYFVVLFGSPYCVGCPAGYHGGAQGE